MSSPIEKHNLGIGMSPLRLLCTTKTPFQYRLQMIMKMMVMRMVIMMATHKLNKMHIFSKSGNSPILKFCVVILFHKNYLLSQVQARSQYLRNIGGRICEIHLKKPRRMCEESSNKTTQARFQRPLKLQPPPTKPRRGELYCNCGRI